jgi:LPS-assembly protein
VSSYRPAFDLPLFDLHLAQTLTRILGLAALWPLCALAQECPAPATGAAPQPATRVADDSQAPIEVTSEGAELTRAGDAVLKGKVRIRQGSRTLSARNAQFDASERRFTLEGDVEYADPELRVRGTSADVAQEGTASFEGAEFELPARQARGAAQHIRLEQGGTLELDGVRYTTCPVGNEDWVLKAAGIDINQQTRTGTGRNVRLDFKGVPILYTPIISFPVGDQRKSGFLFPNFGQSSRGGTEIAVPWYWNIAPNYDATLTPTWMSRRGIDLGTEFRYLTEEHRGQLDIDYLPHDDLYGDDRSYARLVHQTDFNPRLRFSADAGNVSDSDWFEDFGLGPEGTSVTYVGRLAQADYLGDYWTARGRVQQFQTIDQTIDPLDRPYTVLPQIAVRGLFPDLDFGLTADLGGEFVNFDREEGVVGRRIDVWPQFRLPLRAPGMYVEPAASWRYTAYDLDETAPGADRRPSRSMPVFSVDSGLTFERPSGSRDQRLITLEPRIFYLYVPYRDQSALPIFDTGVPDLNLFQLFRSNRYVGPDRFGDANQLSFGLTTRMFDQATGRQLLSASVAQAFFFDQPRVTLPDEPPETDDWSDIVALLELTAYDNWNVNMGIQWDPAQTRSERGEIRLQYQPRYDSVVNLGYRFRRDSVEQIEGSVAWPVARDWSVYARMVYSLQDERTLERLFGFEYRACCWRLRLVSRRYVSSRTGESDSSIQLQLELNGLSSVGVAADAFLEHSIRGYSARPDTP